MSEGFFPGRGYICLPLKTHGSLLRYQLSIQENDVPIS